jgi:hypothetical protein
LNQEKEENQIFRLNLLQCQQKFDDAQVEREKLEQTYKKQIEQEKFLYDKKATIHRRAASKIQAKFDERKGAKSTFVERITRD